MWVILSAPRGNASLAALRRLEHGPQSGQGARSHAERGNEGHIQHIAEHGLSREEVEQVLCNPTKTGVSRTSRRPMAFGYTEWGSYIGVVYEQVDENTVYPVTAFELEED